MSWFILNLAESLCLHLMEKFTSSAFHCDNGQNERCVLLSQQSDLEDFNKFDSQDTIFQEYDPPSLGDYNNMDWKRSRPTKWWISLWKAMKCVVLIQILGGLAVGLFAIGIVVLELNSVDLCYELQHQNWTSVPKKIQNIIVTADTIRSFPSQLWSILLMITMFGWPFVKRLNLLFISLIASFVDMTYRLYLHIFETYTTSWRSVPLNTLSLLVTVTNSILVARAIVNNRELEGLSKIRKTVEITLILCGQFLFAMILAYTLVYLIIPFYDSKDDTYRVVITCAFPLSAVLPKAILRLVLQRISFLHPGRSYILLSTLYNGCTIVFRVMQAELGNQKLFILMSCLHGCVHLLERLTILLRDYLWFFILNKLQRDSCAQEVLSTGAIGFRTPRSMRLVADMSIQMILGESTALVTAVGYIQMYRFMYNGDSPSLSDMHLTEEFFIRVAIGLSIEFMFNSFTFWLQMSHFNVAVVRVWRKKWKKHMIVCVIQSALTICFFAKHLFPIVKLKQSSADTNRHFNCTGPFSRF